MDRELVYVVHSDPEVAGAVCNALLAFDYKVVKMTSESEAEKRPLRPFSDLGNGSLPLIRKGRPSPFGHTPANGCSLRLRPLEDVDRQWQFQRNSGMERNPA